MNLKLFIVFSSISKVYFGESFVFNKLILDLFEHNGVILLNKSEIANCISSYKNNEALIKPNDIYDSISLNLP